MYSCIIPDENGVEQVLHFGLYDYGFTSGETALSIITSMTEETTLYYKRTQTCSTPLKPSILKSIENKLAAELEKSCKESEEGWITLSKAPVLLECTHEEMSQSIYLFSYLTKM